MEVKTLNKAIAEAERFIEMAKNVTITHSKFSNGKPWVYISGPQKEVSATCRASMDLTRTLSDLRQNR